MLGTTNGQLEVCDYKYSMSTIVCFYSTTPAAWMQAKVDGKLDLATAGLLPGWYDGESKRNGS